MSLITTCPACGTTFRVTPEQLSAHRGDVRCGQCQHIFNALKQLEEVAPSSPREEPAIAPIAELVETDFDDTVVMMAAPETVELPESIDTPSEIELAAEPEPEPEPETLEHELPQPGLAAVDFELDFSREAPVTSTSEPEIDLQAAPVDAELPPPVTPEPAPEPVQPAAEMVVPQPVAAPVEPAAIPVFLQSAPKRRLPLWLFIPFALLLVLAAVAQTAYFLRTEIAARYPVAKPWLEQACQPLACKVELPRQAELLNIEDSDLQADPDHDGVLVLVSALYNRASYAQAYPLFELTLTDKFDKPMLRRTFTPQEYLPQGTAIQAGIAAGGEAHSRLALTVEGEKPAGYRLYVRY